MTIRKRPEKYAQTVRDIINEREYLTFSPKDTTPDMIERMQIHGGGAAGVIDDSGRFLGLITEREIVRKAFGTSLRLQERLDQLSQLEASDNMTAKDMMIANADVLNPHDTVEDALDIITYFGYRYMPVVNSDRTLAGIVDARELNLHAYLKSQDALKSKDMLLSYYMGSEPYGSGAATI
mgnify:CR=1 FL=1